MHHFGALAGVHRGLSFDRELLYAGAMFHDIGLMPKHSSKNERFEVDGAHAARDFLKSYGVPDADVYTVWSAIVLRTALGVPVHDAPRGGARVIGRRSVLDVVLGLTYAEYSAAEREAVVGAFPRTERFKEDIIQAFYDGIKHKPDTTFGNESGIVPADGRAEFSARQFLCSDPAVTVARLE